MAASLQLRPQNRNLGMMVRDVDEDLAIYLGVRNVEEEITNAHLLSEELDDLKELGLLKTETDDNLLSLETDKGDDDWLLTQAIPAKEAKDQDPVVAEEASSAEAISLKSKQQQQQQKGNTCHESGSSGKPRAHKRPSSSSSGSRKPNPRSLPAKSKPSRPSTPTSRATIPSSKPEKALQTRSSAPSKAAIVSKSSSRSSTPTRKTSMPPSESKCQMTVKSLPSLDTLSKSHNGPQTLKTSMPKRPLSASRSRPSSTKTSSSNNAKLRQKSCSPAKTRGPVASGGNKTGNPAMLSRTRGYGNDGKEVNPVIMGTKMVERVVNMRKLAPPKQEECVYTEKPKKPSKDNSGFGRSLSNKSLDMALRHMDIRRSIPENLRPVATSSGKAGVRTRGAKRETTTVANDVSGSPLTSSGSESSKYSSADSSKSSLYHFLKGGSEMDLVLDLI